MKGIFSICFQMLSISVVKYDAYLNIFSSLFSPLIGEIKIEKFYAWD